MKLDRTTLGYAVLLSVPPGVGTASFMQQTGRALVPSAIVGTSVAVVLFGFIVLVVNTGGNVEDREAGELD